MTASLNIFNAFVAALANGAHSLGSDQIVVALTNIAPSLTNTQLSNITQIDYTNLSSRNITTDSSLQSAGVYRLKLADLVLTASATVPPFRYLVLYNDSSAGDLLIGYYDAGTIINLGPGQTITLNFDGSNGALILQQNT